MTADRRAALVERMADAIAKAWDDEGRLGDGASAALDLALEEAAKVAIPKRFEDDGDPWNDGWNAAIEQMEDAIAATIRALKGKP